MNRRDAFKTLAGIFGAALVDPTALIASVRAPLPESLRIVIPNDEGFLIDSVYSVGSKGVECKVILPNETGFSIPQTSYFSGFQKIYLAPGTILEMPGESGSMLTLFGVALHQPYPPTTNDVDCYYKTYWLDGRPR